MFLFLPISYLAFTILWVMGWSELPEKMIDKFKSNMRLVCVFSHTSAWDFYILSLYLLAYPEELKYVRFMMRPDFFDKPGGWILYKLGALPGTKITESNGGAVEKTAESLNKLDRFVFLISPKGSIMRREWKSGFYHIANQTNASLTVVGLDYVERCPVITKIQDDILNKDTVIKKLQEDLSTIVPFYRDQEVVDIKMPGDPHICDFERLQFLLVIWIMSYGLYDMSLYYNIFSVLGAIIYNIWTLVKILSFSILVSGGLAILSYKM